MVIVQAGKDADLIIVGSRGLNPVQRMLGSVSSKVVHRATCEVLVVRQRAHDSPTRLLPRLLMRGMHHPTDVSQEYDYTDWDPVDRWAREFAAELGG